MVSEQAKASCDFQSTIVLWRGFESPRERDSFTLLTEQSASLQNVPWSHHTTLFPGALACAVIRLFRGDH